MKLTDLRVKYWCRICQATTYSEDCPRCEPSGTACIQCHTCTTHGTPDMEDT